MRDEEFQITGWKNVVSRAAQEEKTGDIFKITEKLKELLRWFRQENKWKIMLKEKMCKWWSKSLLSKIGFWFLKNPFLVGWSFSGRLQGTGSRANHTPAPGQQAETHRQPKTPQPLKTKGMLMRHPDVKPISTRKEVSRYRNSNCLFPTPRPLLPPLPHRRTPAAQRGPTLTVSWPVSPEYFYLSSNSNTQR